MEMGTGKTRVALTFAHRERYDRVLIVCPISVSSVWEQEIEKLGLDVVVRNLTSGSIVQRRQILDFYRNEVMPYDGRPLYVLVNYESFWRMPLREVIQKWRPDLVILDEAHRIKGRTTRQSKFAHSLTAIVGSRVALSGTPVTNGLQDLFSIYKFIDPLVFGTRYVDFESRYVRKGGFQGYSIVGYQNEEEIAQKVRDTAFQISKADALDLPERTDTTVHVKLTAKTRSKYQEVKKNAIAEIEGTGEDGLPRRGVVLARIVLTTILRLQQITSGFISTDTGEIIVMSGEKVQACKEITEDALAGGHQVVVFCRFLKDISRLAESLPQSATISGSVPQQERARRLKAFQEGTIKVLICQIQVASLGIDLTASDIGIFYSTGFSLADFLQSRDRLHRHGQTKKVTYYHLVGEKTVDESVYQALQSKQQIASKVVNLDYARKLLKD
jgi:SNF2 family DNA or RNA helicase